MTTEYAPFPEPERTAVPRNPRPSESTTASAGGRPNAEDCKRCMAPGAPDLAYPFLCPGHDDDPAPAPAGEPPTHDELEQIEDAGRRAVWNDPRQPRNTMGHAADIAARRALFEAGEAAAAARYRAELDQARGERASAVDSGNAMAETLNEWDRKLGAERAAHQATRDKLRTAMELIADWSSLTGPSGDPRLTPLRQRHADLSAALRGDTGEATASPLDAAMHSVWLHGGWRWLTSKMTTAEREAAADAVDRYGTALDPGEPREPVARWWRVAGEAS